MIISCKFYYDAYGSTRSGAVLNLAIIYLIVSFRWSYGTSQQSHFIVLLHDAFMPTSYWRGFMPYPNWEGVMIDTHLYQVFSDAVSLQTILFSLNTILNA